MPLSEINIIHQVIPPEICWQLNDSLLKTRSGGKKTDRAHVGRELGAKKEKIVLRGKDLKLCLWLALPENGMYRPHMGSEGTLSGLETDECCPAPKFWREMWHVDRDMSLQPMASGNESEISRYLYLIGCEGETEGVLAHIVAMWHLDTEWAGNSILI